VRRLTPAEREHAFGHTSEPVGDWGVEVGGAVVGTGGFFLPYNPPYGDLYMEVAPDLRRRGYGSYLIQELTRVELPRFRGR
jgi:GNAT superfamily N-acetyltransferase